MEYLYQAESTYPPPPEMHHLASTKSTQSADRTVSSFKCTLQEQYTEYSLLLLVLAGRGATALRRCHLVLPQ